MALIHTCDITHRCDTTGIDVLSETATPALHNMALMDESRMSHGTHA